MPVTDQPVVAHVDEARRHVDLADVVERTNPLRAAPPPLESGAAKGQRKRDVPVNGEWIDARTDHGVVRDRRDQQQRVDRQAVARRCGDRDRPPIRESCERDRVNGEASEDVGGHSADVAVLVQVEPVGPLAVAVPSRIDHGGAITVGVEQPGKRKH